MTSARVENYAFYQRARDEIASLCATSWVWRRPAEVEMNEAGDTPAVSGSLTFGWRGVNGPLEGKMTPHSVSVSALNTAVVGSL